MNTPLKCQTTDESRIFYQQTKSDFIKNHDMKNFSSFKIISLGYDCSVRTILTDWGLKPTKQMGELSYPFDLAFCPHDGMLNVLKNRFDDFFKDLVFNHETGLWENKKYNFYYNHDTDCTEKDYKKFTMRFKNRIKNFYDILNSDLPVIFVAYANNEPHSTQKILKIFKLLKQQRKCKKNYLVILNENKKFILNRDVYSIHIHKPFPEYVWWREEMRYSFMGTEFEQDISIKFFNTIRKIITKIGK